MIPQILSRLFIVWIVFPLVPAAVGEGGWNAWLTKLPIINVCLVCWAVTEVVRYSFYTMGKDLTFLKHLRYNLFLVLYPLGVTCEMLSIAHSCFHVKYDFAPENKPMTTVMPNSVNFTFKYEWAIYICLVIYGSEFPKLFGHMLRQRAKIYAEKGKQ